MRTIKECLRLKLECGLSHERIGRALGLSKGAVSKYVAKAQSAGLDWPALAPLDEAEIEARLCSAPPGAGLADGVIAPAETSAGGYQRE